MDAEQFELVYQLGIENKKWAFIVRILQQVMSKLKIANQRKFAETAKTFAFIRSTILITIIFNNIVLTQNIWNLIWNSVWHVIHLNHIEKKEHSHQRYTEYTIKWQQKCLHTRICYSPVRSHELNAKIPSIIFLKYDSAHANPKRHYFECDLMGFTQQKQPNKQTNNNNSTKTPIISNW